MTTHTTRAHAHARYPLLEQPQVAVILAAVSGALNAWTLANVGSFATVQSGNIVTAGFYIADGNVERVVPVVLSVIAFGIGALLCAVFVTLVLRRRHSYSGWILAFEAVLLAVCGALAGAGAVPPMAVALTVSFIAGVQGNAFHRDSGMLYGNTAVTFVVQMTFSSVGRAAVSRTKAGDGAAPLRIAGLYGSVLLAFAAGAAAGFLLDTVWSAASLLAVSLTLAGLALFAVLARGSADPDQNAPTP